MLQQVPQLVLAGLTVGAGYALVALGIHIILRATRVINFAQGEFVIVGGLLAYTFVTFLHASVWLALAGATLAGFALGLFYERAVLRPAARAGELAATIATIGTVYVLLYGHALIWGSLPQPLPFFSGGERDAKWVIGGVEVAAQQVWVLALLALALLATYLFFDRTTYGKAIRAAANNPLGARLVGIDVDRARAVSVAIGIKGFVGAIVGGLESPVGCAAGGLLVGVIEKLLEGEFGYGIADPVVYSLLLAMLLVRPQGLFGLRGVVRD